jgi:hypothetical protein
MAAKKRRGPKRLALAIPEEVVTRLIDPAQVLPDDEIDAAAACALDEAACEVAAALAETGRPLANLHALRTAAETLGFLRGYRAGALAAGWIVHALARDAPPR